MEIDDERIDEMVSLRIACHDPDGVRRHVDARERTVIGAGVGTAAGAAITNDVGGAVAGGVVGGVIGNQVGRH